MSDTQVDFLSMSDEDLANFDPSSLDTGSSEEATTEQVDTSSEEVETNEEQPTEEQVDEPEDTDDTEQAATQEEEADEESEGSNEVPDTQVEENTESVPNNEETPSEDSVDYKQVYEKLTAPFKANGREIQIKNVEDAISLMQMGANYNKKMAALKPNLKLMKMLESQGLLDESKLNFLIDLSKKNPDAISKLVSESGIDPLDINTEKAGDYKPNSYNVSDSTVELDAVLDEIQDTPSYTRTLDVVSNKWDGASKQVIAKSPQLLKVINSHVQSGIYDLISKELENERMFGRLDGLSDIEAYRQVGDAIQARGGFNHLFNKQGQQTQQAPVVQKPAPKKVDEDKLREKKRAAASSKQIGGTTKPLTDYDPLSMSDEEFAKIASAKYF